MDLENLWEERAAQWIAWARTPGHDAFWAYYQEFLDDIVPPQPGRVLEVGCGEGRVGRELVKTAASIVALDRSGTLLEAARTADARPRYVLGDAARLPFEDGSFDTVVAYNTLQNLDDMPGGVSEAERVLVPGGHLCVCIVHPMREMGDFESEQANARFVIEGSYFEHTMLDEVFQRDGLTMRFTGPHYPLSDYTIAFEGAGLLIERLREPLPDPAVVAEKGPAWARSERMPMFLFIRALKR
ncbi:MAG: class I SAM-dependent methyltransferase [Actinomycetota bacterium]